MAYFSDLPLEWIKEHLGNSEARLWVWLRGCFLRGLAEEGSTALNAWDHPMGWALGRNKMGQGSSELNTGISLSLLSGARV